MADDLDTQAQDPLATLADEEGWLAPRQEIHRVKLRPWQQVLFWCLRVYIVIMLVVMGWGFYHALGH